MYQGLCLIPEGRKNKDYINKKSEITNVSIISNLDMYLSYAENLNLAIMFISNKQGLVYIDDILESSPMPIYKYSNPKLRLWSKIIAEQIFRKCLDTMVSEVHIMISKHGSYKFLISELKQRGVKVYTPYIH